MFDSDAQGLSHFNQIPNLEILPEIPNSIEDLTALAVHQGQRYLLLIDDYQNEFFSSPVIAACFTRLSHHSGIDVAAICQNAFPSKVAGGAKYFNDIWRNTNCFFLFRNPSDVQCLNNLSLKIFGKGKASFLADCIQSASQLLGPRAYICVDLDVQKESTVNHSVRTLIVPHENLNLPCPLLFKNI